MSSNTSVGKLTDFLLYGYNPMVRPVHNSSQSTVLTITPQVYQIIELVRQLFVKQNTVVITNPLYNSYINSSAHKKYNSKIIYPNLNSFEIWTNPKMSKNCCILF